MISMNDLIPELTRLNQRYENVKNNPNWTEEMLNILITAQKDLYDTIHQEKKPFDWKTLPGNQI